MASAVRSPLAVRRNPSSKELGIWWGQLQSLSCVPVGRAHTVSQLQTFGEAGRSQPCHRRSGGRGGLCPAPGSHGACCVNFCGHSQQVPSRNASYISLKCLCICFPWPQMGSCRVPGGGSWFPCNGLVYRPGEEKYLFNETHLVSLPGALWQG